MLYVFCFALKAVLAQIERTLLLTPRSKRLPERTHKKAVMPRSPSVYGSELGKNIG